MDIRASKVESSSDILQDILVRLPVKSVFKCRSVSKRWNKLVSDPYFRKRYSSQHKRIQEVKCKDRCYYGGFLGFIQTTKWFSYRGCKRRPWEPTHRFLSINNGDAATGLQNPIRSVCFPEKLGYFISSSNGLILCGRHPRTYHVVNPITKRWVSLPPPKRNYGDAAAGLSCEEEESTDLAVRYKVVKAAIRTTGVVDRTLLIETYTSETREWIESTLTAPYNFALVPSALPRVIRGVFYWRAACCSIAVYDSNKHVGEGENHIQLIELPTFSVGETDARLGTSFWGSDDRRLWMSGSTPMKLNIWMLPKDECGYKSSWSAKDWMLLHVVNSDTLTKYYPPIIENDNGQRRKITWRAQLNRDIRHSNRCVVLEAFISWDPIVVLLRRGESVCLYNLETKTTMEPVRFHGRPLVDYEYWNSYFEPISLSSYALGLNLN